MGDLILFISQLCGGVWNHSIKIPPIPPTCRHRDSCIGTKLTAGVLAQAVENAELSNIFAHSTSIPIRGFLCQPGVHFHLWPTGPSAKTLVSGAIAYTIINHTLFAPLPGPQIAKSPLLVIRLPYPGDRPTNRLHSRPYSVLIMCRPHQPFERQG